jgi:hypothetical protein
VSIQFAGWCLRHEAIDVMDREIQHALRQDLTGGATTKCVAPLAGV